MFIDQWKTSQYSGNPNNIGFFIAQVRRNLGNTTSCKIQKKMLGTAPSTDVHACPPEHSFFVRILIHIVGVHR